jgi:hypothetical protein
MVEDNLNELPPLTIERQRALVSIKLKRTLPEVMVNCPRNACDGGYIRALSSVFVMAGIDVPPLVFQAPQGPSETGVMIAAKDPSHVPEPASRLFEILKTTGMRPKVVRLDPNIGAEFTVFVGPKPL